MMMRGRCGFVRILVLILAVLVTGIRLPHDQPLPAHASQLQDLQRELEDMQKQMEAMIKKLSDTKVEERQVLRDLDAIERQLDRTIAQLAKLEGDIDHLEHEIELAAAELAIAEAHLAKRQDYLARRVRAIYESGTVGYLEVLLGSTSFADFISRFELLQQLISKDNELFEQVKEERATVAEHKAKLEAKRNQTVLLKQQASVRQASIQYQQDAKERYLSQVRNDQVLYAKAIDELEETSKQIEQEIRRLAPWGTRPTGKLLWPLTSRRISSYFGRRFHPLLRQYRLHTGIDLPAATGTKAFAAEWGIVRHAGMLGGYGLTIMVDHGGGLWTLYAHLSRIQVKVGETIARGHVIGLVGSTGLSTGPHLHFEVRDNGTPIDPLKWLP